MSKKNAAINAVRDRKSGYDPDRIYTLATGVRAKLRAVPAALITDATSRIKEPQVPMWENKDKGREELNPNDLQYLREVEEYNQAQGNAALDTMLIAGVELVDPIEKDGHWLKRLRFAERRGLVDLSEYDLDDELELDYVYKRYHAVSAADMTLIGGLSGISKEDISAAENSF